MLYSVDGAVRVFLIELNFFQSLCKRANNDKPQILRSWYKEFVIKLTQVFN